jgi:hypothetical protein
VVRELHSALPAKWIADVATAIHFYQAILATLAILVWHFYWVIFDPDVYPMNATWWHGKSSPARIAEHGAAGPSQGTEKEALEEPGTEEPKEKSEGVES